MKQIVIRILAPQIPVFDIQTGSIDQAQGQFIPDTDVEATFLKLAPSVVDLIRYDSLLGGKAFITSDNLGIFIASICSLRTYLGLEFYPNFIVLKIDDDGTEKEEKPR